MTDRASRELNIGDWVMYTYILYGKKIRAKIGKVTGMSEKRVALDEGPCRIEPGNLLIINELPIDKYEGRPL